MISLSDDMVKGAGCKTTDIMVCKDATKMS